MIDSDATIATIRAAAASLPLESPTRGAVVIARLRHGLPASESFPGLSAVQRAMAAVQRTIQHSHRAEATLDHLGNGYFVLFGRHVTEGDERWEFEVEVTVDRDGNAVIADARIVRPGDGADDDEAEDAAGPDPDEQLLPFGMIACPCCGHATLSQRAFYQICPVCFWEDDGQDNQDADEERGGPNRVSLRRGRMNYLQFGASVEADRQHVRRPTAEEVPLRRFDADGREIAPSGDGHPLT